ncbi:YjdJ family protein [Psychrobacillus lasiicapitis]|uniref:DUF4306 domain-containing protein n=1 Tax=Psychrobacillus lasiicapitis TaxID=1636719 RepID=A0A544TI55_9BACI|nr:YjdJ family protein [Psychrobacillus lasiicapitis]TQR17123.1 DUF4306 domain-containing protein [Psychrobacillus lasiicapitis]GGA24280.1 hypothetical protein GCM10011384_11830 [Psychrobacillus lasiicapitis]
MFRYVLQLIIGIFTLVVATFIAWFEGSALTINSLEWKYSTPFTKLFNVEITNGRDISQLDYFVYAAKFQPLFPAIMMGSAYYILSVVGYYLMKYKPKWAISFWGLIGCMMILVSGFIFNSATMGGKIFFWVTLVSGLIGIAVAVSVYFKHYKQKVSVSSYKNI